MGKKRKSLPVTFMPPPAGAVMKSNKKAKPPAPSTSTTSTHPAAAATATAASSGSAGGGGGGSLSALDRALGLVDRDPLALLVAPEDPAAFKASHWEQRPRVFKATPERAAFFRGLLALPHYLDLARRREGQGRPFHCAADVNAARYRNGRRETLTVEVADAAALAKLHNEQGCTLQVIQPQRWEDKSWRLVAALEAQVGCLVGANAYLTPKGTQGLAPHTDPVEIFVVQTQGRKRWRLYEPVGAFPLPNQASGDLAQDAIGAPVLDVTLEVGDVLYMPRGTVHQAVAQSDGDSAHLTLSTYAQWSYGDLAAHVLEAVGHNVTHKLAPDTLPLALRRSPPLGFVFEHSLLTAAPNAAANTDAAASAAAAATATATASKAAASKSVKELAAALRAFADHIEARPKIVATGAYSLALDFLGGRLPPHPAQLPPKGPMPEMGGDALQLRVPAGSLFLLPYTVKKVDFGDGDGEEGGAIKLCHNLENSRALHMMGAGAEEGEEENEEAEAEGLGEGGGGDGGSSSGSDSEGGSEAPEEEEGEGDEDEGAEAPMSDDEGMEEGGEEEEEEEAPQHPLDAIPGMIFPGKFRPAVALLAQGKPVKVQALPLKEERDRMELAMALWSEGLVSTLRKKKHGKKAKALQGNRGDAIGGRLVNPLGLGGQLPQVKGVVEKKQH